MPFNCEHCGETFSAKRNLNKHQSSASYCLNIQKKKGIPVKYPEFKCECGQLFTQKASMNRHQIKCSRNKTMIESDQDREQDETDDQDIDNINVNKTPTLYSMKNLTPEYIVNTLRPVLTMDVIKKGMRGVVELVIEHLIQKDGSYIYYCTDRNRYTFRMLIETDGELIEEYDRHAHGLRYILRAPLQNIVVHFHFLSLKDLDKNTRLIVKKTLLDIEQLESDGVSFNQEMGKQLPSNSTGTIPCSLKDILISMEQTHKLLDVDTRLKFDHQNLLNKVEKEQKRQELKKKEQKTNEEEKMKNTYWNKLKGLWA